MLSLEAEIGRARAEVIQPSLPRIRGDRRKLIALFREVLGNAMKFRRPERLKIEIAVYPAGDNCMISVRDNGVGVPAGKEEVIFKPFKRLHGHEHSGTGMGLAICRRIVHLHKGRMWAEPAAGNGTDIRFTLPLAEPQGPSSI
jgi:signal transduction histidine kinase